MKKVIIPSLFFALCAVTGIWGYEKIENAQEQLNSDLLLANIEALASNETGTDSQCKVTCNGLLGLCSYTCTNCGINLNSLGSELVLDHKCSSTR